MEPGAGDNLIIRYVVIQYLVWEGINKHMPSRSLTIFYISQVINNGNYAILFLGPYINFQEILNDLLLYFFHWSEIHSPLN